MVTSEAKLMRCNHVLSVEMCYDVLVYDFFHQFSQDVKKADGSVVN